MCFRNVCRHLTRATVTTVLLAAGLCFPAQAATPDDGTQKLSNTVAAIQNAYIQQVDDSGETPAAEPTPTVSIPNPEQTTESTSTKFDQSSTNRGKRPAFALTDLATWVVYDHYDNPDWDDGSPNDEVLSSVNQPFFMWQEPFASADYNATFYDLSTAKGVKKMEAAVFGSDAPTYKDSPCVARFSQHIYQSTSDNGISLQFLGYGETFKTDWAIAPEAIRDDEIIRFDIDATQLDPHTTVSFGTLINAGVQSGKLRGYALLFRLTGTAKGTLQLIDLSSGVNADALHDGLSGYERISNAGPATDLGTFDLSKPIRLELHAESTHLAATVSTLQRGTPSDSQEFDLSLKDTGLRGFGPFVNSNGLHHTCPRLSRVGFDIRTLEASNLIASVTTVQQEQWSQIPSFAVRYAADANGKLEGVTGEFVVQGSVIENLPEPLPNTGYRFSHWQDDSDHSYTTDQLASLAIAADTSFTAVFAPIVPFTVDYAAGSNGSLDGRASESVNPGQKPKRMPTPVANVGYEFAYWIDQNNTIYATAEFAALEVEGDIQLTAVFNQAAPIMVTYEAGRNGSIDGNTSEFVVPGDSPTNIPTPTANTYYVFKYWEDSNGKRYATTGDLQNAVVDSPTTFTARFAENTPHTVHYAAGKNGALRGLRLETVRAGHAPASLPATIPDTHYQFAYWRDQNGITYESNAVLKQTVITADMTFTAMFERADHQIAYEAGANGSLRGNARETVVYGASPKTPPVPVPSAGYVFAYWESNAGTRYTTTAAVQALVIEDALTLRAVFEPVALEVTFVAGENGAFAAKPAAQSIPYGDSVTRVPVPVPAEGYRLRYWLDQDGVRYADAQAIQNAPIVANTTFTAVFDAIRMDVSYIAGTGGQLKGTANYTSVAYGSKLAKTAPAPTPLPDEGYHFVAWRDTRGDVADPAAALVSEDTARLVAIFERDANGDGITDTEQTLIWIMLEAEGPGRFGKNAVTSYTATLDRQGKVMLGQIPGFVEPQLIPTTSTDAGARFFGWEDAKGNAIADLSSHVMTGSGTLFAFFDTDADGDGLPDSRQARIYTVTFKTKGGGDLRGATTFLIAAQPNAILGSAIGGYAQPQPVSIAGKAAFYRFEDAAGNPIPITARFPISSDTVIYAVFAEDANVDGIADPLQNAYTLTFEAGTGGELEGDTSALLIGGTKGDGVPLTVHDAVGGTIKPPTVIANKGFTFIGWTPEFNAEELQVSGDTTFTATFLPETRINSTECLIRFTMNGKTLNAFLCAKGTKFADFTGSGSVSDPEAPPGYHFIGWLSPDGKLYSTGSLSSWKANDSAEFKAAFITE